MIEQCDIMYGLSTVNVELTSRCNKSCHMCGRRKIEQDYPELRNWGDMDFKLVKSIASQLPRNTVVQFHNNGDPLLYPWLGGALHEFKNQIRCFNTNGKLLLEKAEEIIDNVDTITISVIENDPESDMQYAIVKKFLEIKGDRKPRMIYRLLGDVGKNTIHEENEYLVCTDYDRYLREKYRRDRWHVLEGTVVTRVLHSPMGSFNYEKKTTIPEIGICLEVLNKMVIDRFGNVSYCVRFDPNKHLVYGNANEYNLTTIWNSKKRKEFIEQHVSGNRGCNETCSKCHFWGVPRG